VLLVLTEGTGRAVGVVSGGPSVGVVDSVGVSVGVVVAVVVVGVVAWTLVRGTQV